MWNFRKYKTSDEALVAGIEKADKVALDELYRRYASPLRNFVLGMTKDKTAAEDIVQNIFMRLFLSRPFFRSVEAFKGWLYVCARNEVINFLNSKWSKGVVKTPESEALLASVPADNVPELLAEQEVQRSRYDAVHSALEDMPERRADVFRMSKIDKLPNDEISRRLGISPRTVEKHLQLAYKELRQKIS